MKTTPKKSLRVAGSESTMRLRDSRQEPHAEVHAIDDDDDDEDDDIESELPIRGRPSKKLLLQQQRFQVKLQPELKTVAAAAIASTGGTSRSKAKRELYKKGSSNYSNSASQKAQSESYVMRLFERSLDLSKYKDKTPLYPICRAWMANQPRNPGVATYNSDSDGQNVKREDNGEELLAKLLSGELKVLKQLPQARSTNLPLIPPRLISSEEEKEAARELEGASKEQLLADNTMRWKKVRGHWLKHAHQYAHERYETIDQIMDAVCQN